MQKQSTRENLKDYILLTLGTVIVALSTYFFKFPNHFSTGGISGLSIILGQLFPSFTPGAYVFIINQLLLLAGFAVFGKSFGVRTAYVSLVLSGITWGLEYIVPLSSPMTDEPLLELIFCVALHAIGSAILFNRQASSGGTDIIAMILRKYTSLNIGNALLCVDISITILAGVVFGIETGLFSVLGLALKSVIVDMVLENLNVHKVLQIITSKPDEITAYITGDLKRGATRIDGKGAYTHEDKTIILTVVNRMQAVRLRQYARSVDAQCFILITNTTEIIGNGFRGVM